MVLRTRRPGRHGICQIAAVASRPLLLVVIIIVVVIVTYLRGSAKLAQSVAPQPQIVQMQPQATPVVQGQSVAKSGDSGGSGVSDKIAKIKELKELLDAGALTQEEFDAQKKAIL